MTIQQLSQQTPFITKDGSTIRSLLDLSNAPVKNQSLAEATVPAGLTTERHYHKVSEEFYYIISGKAIMEIEGIEKEISSGDTVLIPAGSWHKITGIEETTFLCCCSPPYSHEDTFCEE